MLIDPSAWCKAVWADFLSLNILRNSYKIVVIGGKMVNFVFVWLTGKTICQYNTIGAIFCKIGRWTWE